MASSRTAHPINALALVVNLPIYQPFTKSKTKLTYEPEFAQGKVDPVEAGKLGGHTSGGSTNVEETTSSDNSGGSAKGGMLLCY